MPRLPLAGGLTGVLLTASLLGAFALVGGGCDAAPQPGGAADIVGKTATVEFKPYLAADNKDVHKQRTGILRQVSTDWVVVEENNTPIWIPTDTVLEIRVGS